jgi:hypothetical protein
VIVMTSQASSTSPDVISRPAETLGATAVSLLVFVAVGGFLSVLDLPEAMVHTASTSAGGLVPAALLARQRRARAQGGVADHSGSDNDPTVNPALVCLLTGFTLALADFLLNVFAYGTILFTGFPMAEFGETQADYDTRLYLMSIVREAPLLFFAAALIAVFMSRRLGTTALRWLMRSVPLYALLTMGLNILYHVGTDSVEATYLGPELAVLPALVGIVLTGSLAGYWFGLKTQRRSLLRGG